MTVLFFLMRLVRMLSPNSACEGAEARLMEINAAVFRELAPEQLNHARFISRPYGIFTQDQVELRELNFGGESCS